MSLPARIDAPQLPGLARELGPDRLVEDWLSSQRENTRRAYQRDLRAFADWAGARSIEHAAGELVRAGAGGANAVALEWRTSLLERGLAPATVNRSLSALRSLVRLARTLGLCDFELAVRNLKTQPYRDVRGPGRRGFLALLAEAEHPRDRALLRLLYDLALRRGEAVRLDLGDVDLAGGRVSVLGKGRLEATLLELPRPTREVLEAWVAERGDWEGPLFVRLDRCGSRQRLSGRSVARLVGRLAARAGLGVVRPHGLRHAAVTDALELSGGDLRAVSRFARHANPATTMLYDDARRDVAGQIARQVAGAASE